MPAKNQVLTFVTNWVVFEIRYYLYTLYI